jgi:hypothetical protein
MVALKIGAAGLVLVEAVDNNNNTSLLLIQMGIVVVC